MKPEQYKDLKLTILNLLKPTDREFTKGQGELQSWFTRKLEADAGFALANKDGLTEKDMDIFRVLVFDNRSMDSVAREFATSMRTVGRIRDRVMACIIRDMPEEMILEILGEDKYVKYKDVTLPKWRYKSCLRCGKDDPMGRVGDLFWNEVEGAWQCFSCGAMHLEEVFGDLRLITLIQAGGNE